MIESLITLGFALVVLGFILLLLGTVVSVVRKIGTEVRKGAIIIIGPIPIVLADDPQTAKILMILALILMFVSVLMILLVGRG